MTYKCIVCRIKRPSYGFPNGKREYCNDCKKEGMVNIKHQKCIICQKKRPHFGFPNAKAKYCGDCKKEDMIDVDHIKCIICQKKHPSFGFPNTKAEYCKNCKKEGMISFKNKNCIICHKKRGNFGFPNGKAEYCGDCKKNGMIDIYSPKCKSEWCDTYVNNNKYEGYCTYCFRHLFPDKPMTRNLKTREIAVVEYIKDTFPNIDLRMDKRIPDGCSKRKPDIYIDLGYQIIIVEIDENQHINYDCSCENKRIMELSQDVNHRPIIFIRFNPDGYDNIASCWSINKKTGISHIKKDKQNEWNERLKTLSNTLKYWLQENHQSHKMIEIIQLYYDGFNIL